MWVFWASLILDGMHLLIALCPSPSQLLQSPTLPTNTVSNLACSLCVPVALPLLIDYRYSFSPLSHPALLAGPYWTIFTATQIWVYLVSSLCRLGIAFHSRGPHSWAGIANFLSSFWVSRFSTGPRACSVSPGDWVWAGAISAVLTNVPRNPLLLHAHTCLGSTSAYREHRLLAAAGCGWGWCFLEKLCALPPGTHMIHSPASTRMEASPAPEPLHQSCSHSQATSV